MSTVKKGTLTSAAEWAKHLRPFGKQRFWSRERKAVAAEIVTQSCGCIFCDLGLEPDANGNHRGDVNDVPVRCPLLLRLK